MNTTKRLLITSVLLLLGAYSIYTTVRIQQLETRLHREQIRPSSSQITYAFDDSFRKYFGEQGVAAVERAREILRSSGTEPAPKIESVDWDFLSDPLRLDGRKE